MEISINMPHQNVTLTNRVDLRAIEDFLLPNGTYVIPYAQELLKFSPDERMQFGHKYGMYTLPTLELIDFLKALIGTQKAVEIGSGVGIIGQALGIPCTDNYCQDHPAAKAMYAQYGQTTIKYGAHVLKRDAEWVARKWQPDIILGSWITHKYVDPIIEGNMFGPDEAVILQHCKQYVMLGHERIHSKKPIANRPHKIIKSSECPFYVTRSWESELNAIFIWEGEKSNAN